MKKSTKIILVSIALFFTIVIGIIAYGISVDYRNIYWSPDSQPNTEWTSEDGDIVFAVNDSGVVVGTIIINGKSVGVDILPLFGGNTIWVVPTDAEAIKTGQYDSWEAYYVSKKKFIAIVEYDGLFFKKGEKITFYRQD